MTYPLQSPGVDITVTSESFYSNGGPGTIPLFIIGTHEYKALPSDPTRVATGTYPENANTLYRITSQRDLIQIFGNPIFYTSGGNPLHGHELNEYGLHAVYSYLGIANTAYVIRSDIDYNQLKSSPAEPVGEPDPGTYWLDTSNSVWGLFLSNGSSILGNAWDYKLPLMFDAWEDIEQRIIGTMAFADTNATLGLPARTTTNLDINNARITVTDTMTLADVLTAINAANIPNVTAVTLRLVEKTYVLLRNSNASGTLIIQNTSNSNVLNALGLTAPGNKELAPSSTIGNDRDLGITPVFADNPVYQKIKSEGISLSSDPNSTGFWFKVGTPAWKQATPTRAIGSNAPAGITVQKSFTLDVDGIPANQITIAINPTQSGGSLVDDARDAVNNAVAATLATTPNHPIKVIQAFSIGSGTTKHLVIANKDGTDINIKPVNASSTILADLGLVTSNPGNRLTFAPVNVQNSVVGNVWIRTTAIANGASWVIKQFNGSTGQWDLISAPLYVDDVTASQKLGTSVSTGTLYVRYNLSGVTVRPIADFQIRRWDGSEWRPLTGYQVGVSAPVGPTPEGTYWFNSKLRVDIMINDGSRWVGYKNFPGFSNTDPNGVIMSASAPLYQTVGARALVDNDLWLDTSDTENYPKLSRYNSANRKWVPINRKDDYSPFGIIFADARSTATSSLSGPTDPDSMLHSNFVDPDVPDPLTYPAGLLMFNTRFSTNNVKQWRGSYFIRQYDTEDYTLDGYVIGEPGVQGTSFPPVLDAGRWVTVSGSAMGRKAQRVLIVRALGAAINGNEDLKSETVYFNLIACPGYPELVDEMVLLNQNKKEVAFVVGDTPVRLTAAGTDLLKWANPDLTNVASNGEDGLLTHYSYLGVYYPWGLGSNIDGSDIMIPPSTMAMRVIAYSDSVSYPWFAPAGFNRGLVQNASSVGYLDIKSQSFTPVFLNNGQRDVLYQNNINPIAYIPNRGLVVYGQKTRDSNTDAMDRINVARLTNYMRYNLDILAKPFLFEPNDKHTRDSVKVTFERFLANLVALRALADFLVICDETNNTPVRIDNNELWVDVLIIPIKAIEFIYIPIRIENTGVDLNAIAGNNR